MECLKSEEGQHVIDLMCGMGEFWPALLRQFQHSCSITALDFSEGMLAHAMVRKLKLEAGDIKITKQNMLANDIPDCSADHIISGFGLKTFSRTQQEQLASEISRILKPQGTFSLIEVSVPSFVLLRKPYLFYLKWIIPLIGRCFLGSPESYQMLGVYTEKFGNCREFTEILQSNGLVAIYREYFWGCATGVSGLKREGSA